MRILHTLDCSNRGGIQSLIFMLYKHSEHIHQFWASDGSMAAEMRQGGMTLWNVGPPEEIFYDAVVGHTVGGWSHENLSKWAYDRGSKFVECMHSNAYSPTPQSSCDGFIALSDIALGYNRHMNKATRIYGICDVKSFTQGRGDAIGRLSRLADEKRPQDFMIIASTFRREKFLLAGDGAMFQMLKEQSPMNMEMVGWVTDHPSFYSKLKLFVFPTRDECCAMSLAMAQANGLPCIVQDLPAIRESTGGYAVFCNDLPDMCSKVGNFLEHPDSYEEVAHMGRVWAENTFDIGVTARAWDMYLDNL